MFSLLSPARCRRAARALLLSLAAAPLSRPAAAQTYGVQVSPDGSPIASKTNFTTGLTYAFRVQNEGTQQDTYTLNCVGAFGITCTNWPASITLAGASFQNVTVTFSTAGQGTGQLYLSANSAQASDTGWVYVPVVPGAGQPRASVVKRWPDTLSPREPTGSSRSRSVSVSCRRLPAQCSRGRPTWPRTTRLSCFQRPGHLAVPRSAL